MAQGKKLTLTISRKAYGRLEQLARQRGETISQAFQTGMSLYMVAATAQQGGRKFFIASADDKEEQEVVVPRGAASGKS